jgi:NAD(P)-dependent dehydrogenase (short-subunit alcohol dehydrogenase family)
MMAKALSSNGASKVYILGRRKDKLESAAKSTPHNNVIPLVCDVTSKDSLLTAASQIRSSVGHINLLICNAGVSGPSHGHNLPPNPSIHDLQAQILSTPPEEFTKAFEVNVTGVYYTAFAFLDLLAAGNNRKNYSDGKVQSQILITSSIAAFNRSLGTGFAYNSSKAAVTHLTKMLATYFVPWQIRVNAMAPGLFPSEISAVMLGEKAHSGEGAFERGFLPAERLGDEQDMGGTVLYLVSRAGAYVNGCVLVVDGGRLCILPGSY